MLVGGGGLSCLMSYVGCCLKLGGDRRCALRCTAPIDHGATEDTGESALFNCLIEARLHRRSHDTREWGRKGAKRRLRGPEMAIAQHHRGDTMNIHNQSG